MPVPNGAPPSTLGNVWQSRQPAHSFSLLYTTHLLKNVREGKRPFKATGGGLHLLPLSLSSSSSSVCRRQSLCSNSSSLSLPCFTTLKAPFAFSFSFPRWTSLCLSLPFISTESLDLRQQPRCFPLHISSTFALGYAKILFFVCKVDSRREVGTLIRSCAIKLRPKGQNQQSADCF